MTERGSSGLGAPKNLAGELTVEDEVAVVVDMVDLWLNQTDNILND